jgi:hypothetical protein
VQEKTELQRCAQSKQEKKSAASLIEKTHVTFLQ